MTPASEVSATSSVTPRRTLPSKRDGSAMSSTMRLLSSSISRAPSNSLRPGWVRTSDLARRSNSGVPANPSSSPTRLATADWVVCSLREDALKLPSTALQ
ncbi:Uncharacterised protein [Bordetella pertussis]|nr:Uncharacterised protein [Bordetella pertussis]